MTEPVQDVEQDTPSRLKQWLIDVVVGILGNPQVQTFIRGSIDRVLAERILPMLPILAAAAGKAAMDQAIEKIPGAEGVVDMVKTIDDTRHNLDKLIPDVDFGNPLVDGFLDFWRPKS